MMTQKFQQTLTWVVLGSLAQLNGTLKRSRSILTILLCSKTVG